MQINGIKTPQEFRKLQMRNTVATETANGTKHSFEEKTEVEEKISFRNYHLRNAETSKEADKVSISFREKSSIEENKVLNLKETSNDDVEKNSKSEVAFGDKEDAPEKKKKKFSFKKFTNVFCTVAGLAIIGASAIYMSKRPNHMKIVDKKAGSLTKKIEVALTDSKSVIKEKEGKGSLALRFGAWINSKVDTIGDELTNNILYAIGTLCVMPPVILWSPFGKKNSTKEDKLFAVLRQPISFATMFSMQLTFDKLLGRVAKTLKEQNAFEDQEIIDEDGKIKANTKPEKVKFNENFHKKIFEKDLEAAIKTKGGYEKIKGELKSIYDLKSAKVQSEKLDTLLKDSSLNIEASKIKELTEKFNKYTTVKGKTKLVTESSKIAVNVLVSQVIGCTLLNVIYGKVMKAREKGKEKQAKIDNLKLQVEALSNTNKANNIEGVVA